MLSGLISRRFLLFGCFAVDRVLLGAVRGQVPIGCREKNAVRPSATARGFCTCSRWVTSGTTKGSTSGSHASSSSCRRSKTEVTSLVLAPRTASAGRVTRAAVSCPNDHSRMAGSSWAKNVPPVQPRPPVGVQLLVQGVPDDRVDEVVPGGRPLGDVDQAGGDRLVQAAEERLLRQLGDGPQDREVEPGGQRRSRVQHRPRRSRQPRQPPGHHVPDPWGTPA